MYQNYPFSPEKPFLLEEDFGVNCYKNIGFKNIWKQIQAFLCQKGGEMQQNDKDKCFLWKTQIWLIIHHTQNGVIQNIQFQWQVM